MKYKVFIFIAIMQLSVLSCNSQSKNTENTKTNYPFELTDEEWKNKLTPEQYKILREKGTERAYTGKYWNHFENGQYVCAGCNTPLFSSEKKFDSHCGWPSFNDELQKGNIEISKDFSHGMVRDEITCKNCGGHLGHVFDDGPPPKGLRYCVNSASIKFIPFKIK
jgi:peptide-methionine (R)-S-oxide reductase